MHVFWQNGFSATSMEDLVSATGVGRGAIYSDFGGKEELFLACLSAYRNSIAESALETLTSGQRGLDAIESYFDFFIGLHKKRGMPGPGCFFANVMTDIAPKHVEVRRKIREHQKDLQRGFYDVLKQAAEECGSTVSHEDLNDLAALTVVSSQGLWSYARSITDVMTLERFKRRFVAVLNAQLCAAREE